MTYQEQIREAIMDAIAHPDYKCNPAGSIYLDKVFALITSHDEEVRFEIDKKWLDIQGDAIKLAVQFREEALYKAFEEIIGEGEKPPEWAIRLVAESKTHTAQPWQHREEELRVGRNSFRDKLRTALSKLKGQE